jgi:hypothetical protein
MSSTWQFPSPKWCRSTLERSAGAFKTSSLLKTEVLSTNLALHLASLIHCRSNIKKKKSLSDFWRVLNSSFTYIVSRPRLCSSCRYKNRAHVVKMADKLNSRGSGNSVEMREPIKSFITKSTAQSAFVCVKNIACWREM